MIASHDLAIEVLLPARSPNHSLPTTDTPKVDTGSSVETRPLRAAASSRAPTMYCTSSQALVWAVIFRRPFGRDA